MGRYFLFLMLMAPGLAFGFLNPPEFVALMPPGGNAVLEAENQISTLCPMKDAVALQKCRAEKLKPRSWRLPLYEEPRKDSKSAGELVVTATPGVGLTAVYEAVSKKSVPVKSDSEGTDWGYSSYFEFSLSDRKGDWMQLPKRPFEKPVWFNLNLNWPVKDMPYQATPMEVGTVYSIEKIGDVVITSFKGTTFTYRMENKNDMLCGEEPAQISPAEMKQTTRPVKDLYDSDGHLIAWVKYSRGC